MAGIYSLTVTLFDACASAAGTTTVTVNATPSALTLGNDGPVCSGSTLNLTASTVSGGTYAWTGPNGFTSSAQNPSIAHATTAASGTYHCTVTVSGCTSASSGTAVTVNPAPTASAISGDASVAIGQKGKIYFVTPTSGSTYAWTVPTGAAIAAGSGTALITVNWGSAASGNVTVTETTSASCVGAPVTLGVTVGPNHAPIAPPNKTLTTVKNTAATYAKGKLLVGATDADSGDTLTVTAASTPTAHGTTSVETSGVKYTPATGYKGPDSYTYTISDGNGGTAIGTVNVTVDSGDGISVNIVSGPEIIGDQFHVTFAGIPDYYYQVQTALLSSGPSYTWSELGSPIKAGGDGRFEFTDTVNGSSPGRVYRTSIGSPTP
jgi:hypothetical protein